MAKCKGHKKHRWGAWSMAMTFTSYETRLRQCKRCYRWQVQEYRPKEGWT